VRLIIIKITLEINPNIDEKETQKAIMKGQKIVEYNICKNISSHISR
jgi:hypothetical protein